MSLRQNCCFCLLLVSSHIALAQTPRTTAACNVTANFGRNSLALG
jgi:hypothetical protein